MSKLAALLGGMTLNDLAKEVLASQGRRGDTQLAHINRREAAILKDMGGSGTINPDTGMEEFYDGMDFSYDALGGDPYGNVTGAPVDYSYMNFPSAYGGDVEAQPGGFYGDVGQPTPPLGGGQMSAPPPESFDLRRAGQPTGFDISTGQGMGFRDIDASLGYPQGAIEAATFRAGGRTPEEVIAEGTTYAPTEPGIGDRIRGAARGAERLARQYPTATRLATAAALGVPGALAGRRARKEAAQTRAEMERMAAPIRAQGEAQLAAGQRGELTASQQQQVQALEAAQAQARARSGVTSGTAAEQDRIRVQEFVQRLAQNNIDNGVRLIGAANSFSAQAIRDAYRMNADAASMTQAYYAQLMRAAGAFPTETTTTVTRTA